MKRIKIAVLFVGIIFCITLGHAARGQGDGLPQDPVERGLAIAPVPLNLEGKDRTLVGVGSYRVNTMCASCHTEPLYAEGGDPYRGQPERINTANYLAGGAHFGPFISRNLTPDVRTGLPAGLTLEEFIRTLRTGQDIKMSHPEFGPLLQVMPWSEIGKLNDVELRAMYEYLRAIPHAEPVL
jgi:hypothetical protein